MPRLPIVIALLFVVSACSVPSDEPFDEPSGDERPGDDDRPLDGELLFVEPQPDGNRFACAHCHAVDEPAGDGIRRPGHSLRDAVNRPSFKNGQLTELVDAVNVCRTEWMAAPAFAADDPIWVALLSYLEGLAPDSSGQELTFSVTAPPAVTTGGSAEAGQALFNESCIVCHGQDGAGTERAPRITGLGLGTDYIAQRIRTSGLEESIVYDDLTGGRMPFWASDRLTDQEVLDLVAYVNESEEPTGGDGNGDGPGDGGAGDGEPRDCGSTHPMVGHVAVLTERFHDVGGVATIADDCTIRIEDFTFDGLGIDVQIYGGLGGNYLAGFSMSGDLRRSTPYRGESLTVQLPESMTLDDLDGISVWCVPAAADFGNGTFEAP